MKVIIVDFLNLLNRKSYRHSLAFLCDGPRMILRGRWRNIIILLVHALSEKKSDDSKDSFYEELEQVLSIIFLSTIRHFY